MSRRRTARAVPGPPVPAPAPARDPGAAPSSLTFFLSAAQRRAALAALKKLHPDRGTALLAALGLPARPTQPGDTP